MAEIVASLNPNQKCHGIDCTKGEAFTSQTSTVTCYIFCYVLLEEKIKMFFFIDFLAASCIITRIFLKMYILHLNVVLLVCSSLTFCFCYLTSSQILQQLLHQYSISIDQLPANLCHIYSNLY